MNNNNHNIPGIRQLTHLRTALAISRGTTLLSTLRQEMEATVSHDQTKRVTYLTMLYTRIHREMFADWREQATASHRPGVIGSSENRKIFRKIIGELVLDGDNNVRTAIFDNNGFVIEYDNIAKKLATFYHKMRQVRLFDYGNRITLDFFMTALGQLPAFKAVYGQGIDFRRLAEGEAALLHDHNTSLEFVIQAFAHVLDPYHHKSLQNQANQFGKWPEKKYSINGLPFLSYTSTQGEECLVTVNGGLAPRKYFNEDFFIPGKHFADYPLRATEKVVEYLPDTEHLRAENKREIDGIEIRSDGVAPLLCLDVNILTGLRAPNHIEFLELLQECQGNKKDLFKLAGNESLKKRMIATAEGDKRLQRGVEIAYQRLGKMNRILTNTLQKIIAGKTPVINPMLFMCMGGAGAGKTAVEEIAYAHCGDNFVIASLDEFRKESDLYKVLTAANHHSDDYVFVEPFANRLRDLVAEHAKNAGINLLYDGTGIPYYPRYGGIINEFKAAGFHTQMTAVDAFLVKPKGREHELSRISVIDSVKARFELSGRALPWVITIDKHIRAPRSFLQALTDNNLDKITLFANDGAKDMHYLVAESFDFSDREIKALQHYQKEQSLLRHLKTLVRNHNDSALKNIADHDINQVNDLMAKNPDFTESNIAYQIYSSHIGHRVLIIYNTRRFIDFMEKRQLNPYASGEEGLLHKPNSLIFHVDPKAEKPWMTRLGSD